MGKIIIEIFLCKILRGENVGIIYKLIRLIYEILLIE
jgi:hypothetical protein